MWIDYSNLLQSKEDAISASFSHALQSLDRHVEKLLHYLVFQKYDRIDRELINKNFDVRKWKKLIFDLSVRLPSPNISLEDWKNKIPQTLADFSKDNDIEFKVTDVIKTKQG